ncbi:MAG TPA: M20/M25/M40 family metallo-hydrolase, partial [SAR324 cluster bacterium]|nr:M20/M25/M40 family metallo-hydrolase [SAR324 cluster bacterium]
SELKQNLPRPRAVIVGEPTEMKVVTAHKGIVALTTTVTGHEAHSSQTHRGVSAVMTASKLIQWLENRAEILRQSATKDSGFEPHFTTIHVGVINGGTAINIISRHCEFCWDIRSIPEDDPQQIVLDFEEYCQKEVIPQMQKIAPETGIQTRCFADAPALGHEPENEAVLLAKELTTETTTRKVPYAAEAGQFQQAGFPTVICGPGSIDQAHQPNEYIERSQLERGDNFLRSLIRSLS